MFKISEFYDSKMTKYYARYRRVHTSIPSNLRPESPNRRIAESLTLALLLG